MARAKRVCKRSECGKVANSRGFCTDHEREADVARGTRIERGYDARHVVVRQKLLMILVMNERRMIPTPCPRCLCPVHSWQKLDADHLTTSAQEGGTADHLSHADCNRAKAVPTGDVCQRQHR